MSKRDVITDDPRDVVVSSTDTPAFHTPTVEDSAAPNLFRQFPDLFAQLAENINEVFWISTTGSKRFLYVSPAYDRVWGRPADGLYGYPESFFENVFFEDRARVVAAFIDQPTRTHNDIEYRIVRPNGQVRWIRTRMYPAKNSRREVERVVCVSEDITERKAAEKAIVEISGRERQRMGQDLHDGVCQQLTGISYMVKALEQRLESNAASESKTASQIGQLIKQAIEQTRSLARGLFPVELESNGLMGALQELAVHTERMFNITCTYVCDYPILLENHDAAMHLYRISQEAITNAVTHGKATQVVIHLFEVDGTVHLQIRNNGESLPESLDRGHGMGLRIMGYRARVIGATLSIQMDGNGGTLVTCSYPNHQKG
jgi:PAS domain S-box-containing protein